MKSGSTSTPSTSIMDMNLVVTVGLMLIHYTIGAGCPYKCICDGNKMSCQRSNIPSEIPSSVTDVYFTQFNFSSLDSEDFNDTSWMQVTLLDIHAEYGHVLRDSCFSKLGNLKHLGLHDDNLLAISPFVFHGLNKVQTLDLSDNRRFHLNHLLPAWDRGSRDVLPALENLILAKLNSLVTIPLSFEFQFMRSVSFNRTLKFLDISYTNIATFDYSQLHMLCSSVEHIKADHASLAYPKYFYNATNCTSLRTLDISYVVLPVANSKLTFEAMEFTCETAHVYDSIEHIDLSGIVKGDFNIYSYHLDMTNCGFRMKKVILKGNHVKWFNVTVSAPEKLANSLSELDWSNNSMEFLAPESLYPFRHLQILRLSNNNLHEMQVHHWEEFSRLLAQSISLREIYFSGNRLVKIPKKIFIFNQQMEYIDMSRNRLQTLDFDIQHLTLLTYLDLSGNQIKNLDQSTRMHLDNFFLDIARLQSTDAKEPTQSQRKDQNVSFLVNLSNNPFVCNCEDESQYAFKWLEASQLIYRTNSSYMCRFQGNSLDILGSTNAVIERDCERQRLLKNLLISIPVCVIFIAAVVVTIVVVRRRRRFKQDFQNFLAALRNGDSETKFLAFVSFCSEDTEFVNEHLSRQLQRELAKQVGVDKDFLCIGDREFHLGLQVHAEITRCMEQSSVIVFVVSKQFCKKSFCQMEVSESCNQNKPTIIVMKEFVDDAEMPKTLKKIFKRDTRACWVQDNDGGHFEPSMSIISSSVLQLAWKGHQVIKSTSRSIRYFVSQANEKQ